MKFALISDYTGNCFGVFAVIQSCDGENRTVVEKIVESRPEWALMQFSTVINFGKKDQLTELGSAIEGLFEIASCFACLVFFLKIRRQLAQLKSHVSERTYKMHRNLTMGLLVQVRFNAFRIGNKMLP